MAKRLSRRKTMRRENTLKRKSFRRKNTLRKTMRRKNTLRRKNINKKGGRPKNMINRYFSLKICEGYFSTSSRDADYNADYNFSTYDHIDNITYNESQVKTFYKLKINVNSTYYTATKSYSELVSDCDKLFSGYPLLSEEMKSKLEKNFSKIMDIKKCLERVKAIEDAMKYLEMNIWSTVKSNEEEIEKTLTSNGWIKNSD